MEFDVAEFLKRLARIYRCENQLLDQYLDHLVVVPSNSGHSAEPGANLCTTSKAGPGHVLRRSWLCWRSAGIFYFYSVGLVARQVF